jgi:hypothetical protein
MTQPVYHDTHTTSAVEAFPLPQFMTRTRREVDPKDAINARHFENWQTRGAYGVMNRPDLNKRPPLFDMAPNDSRMSGQSFRSQPRFDADSFKGGQNAYFDKYDTAADARNTTRELRASVYEDKRTGYTTESQALLQRNVGTLRWGDTSFPPCPLSRGADVKSTPLSREAGVNATSFMEEQVAAALSMRPQRDDIRLFFKPTVSTGDKRS